MKNSIIYYKYYFFLKKISSYLISFHNTNNQSCHLFAVVISTKPWFLSQEALFFQRIHLAPTSERSTRRRRVSLNVSQHVALNRCRLSYILKTDSSVKITKNVWSQKPKTEKKCIFYLPTSFSCLIMEQGTCKKKKRIFKDKPN